MTVNSSSPKGEEGKKRQEKIVSAGIIVFRKSKEGTKFLIMYHGRGYWNFPKGKLEQSERSKAFWQLQSFRKISLQKREGQNF
jgi:hypothetical protein